MQDFLLVTAPTIPGYRITHVYGLVRGNTVRTRDITDDILASFRNLVGGEVHEYRKLLAQSREETLAQVVDEARQMGANAVVGLRISTALISRQMAEILIFGTAVRIEPERNLVTSH